MTIRNRLRGRSQRGVALLVVLILLTVMVLGTLAFTRLSATGVLVAGNAADKDGSLQASESGVNAAYFDVQALADDSLNSGGWYFATAQTPDGDGLPSGVDWNSGAKTADLNGYSVKYAVERLCSVAKVADPARECVIKQADVIRSSKPGELIDPPMGMLYRITVRSTGRKGTATFVQVLMTRGS
jgi:Tfp pilus assembly protein PilX